MSKISRRSVEGFVILRVLLLWTVLIVLLLCAIQAFQPKPKPETPPYVPMYKVGECGQNAPDVDSDYGTGDPNVFWKVTDAGKKNYELLTANWEGKTLHVRLNKQSIETLDPGTKKIDCPKELNDPKVLEKARNGR